MFVNTNKVCDLKSLVTHVREGDCVAIGGGLSWREPMAALRELIRQETGRLYLVGSAHGIDVDLLCGAGLVAVSGESYVGFEQDFGMAPNYRRTCETAQVQVRDSCCYTLVQQLRAAIAGLPFMPIRSVKGTGFMALHPEFKTMICPYTGDELVLVPALRPEIAIIHAQYGDQRGNLRIEGPPVADLLFARASKKVIATVEHIISTKEISERGVNVPYFLVTALSEVPFGAHPTACYPNYAYDRKHTAYYYQQASSGIDVFERNYLKPYVFDCRNHQDYLSAIGGDAAMTRLQSWKNGNESWQALYE